MTKPKAPPPPQDLKAEAGVLGALMVSASALKPVLETGLRADDFYKDQHRMIFTAVLELNGEKKPVDALTVAHELGGHLDDAGGRDYVSSLQGTAPAPGNARHYAQIVQDLALLRRLKNAGQGITAAIADRNGDDPRELAEAAMQSVIEATGLRPDIAFVNHETGEQSKECPTCASRATLIERMSADLDSYRLRLARAEDNREQKITEEKLYPLLKAIHDLWRTVTNHKRIKFDRKEFEPISVRYRQHGLDACLQAVAGVAFDPQNRKLANGRTEKYDLVDNWARNQSVFAKYANRSPVDWEDWLKDKAPDELEAVRGQERLLTEGKRA